MTFNRDLFSSGQVKVNIVFSVSSDLIKLKLTVSEAFSERQLKWELSDFSGWLSGVVLCILINTNFGDRNEMAGSQRYI